MLPNTNTETPTNTTTSTPPNTDINTATSTHTNMDDYEKQKMVVCSRFLILSIIFTGTAIIAISGTISGIYLNNIYNLKHTNMTFTGDYEINVVSQEESNIRYYTVCYMDTFYGSCKYNMEKFKNYQSAENYAIDNCIQNITILGLYSSETDKCYVKIDNIYLENYVNAVIILSSILGLIMLGCIYIEYKYNPHEIIWLHGKNNKNDTNITHNSVTNV